MLQWQLVSHLGAAVQFRNAGFKVKTAAAEDTAAPCTPACQLCIAEPTARAQKTSIRSSLLLLSLNPLQKGFRLSQTSVKFLPF